MDDTQKSSVPNSDRITELWAAMKVLLSGKVDMETLKDYPKVDAVIAAITAALKDYPTDTEMQAAISSALADYMTTSEVNAAIVEAVKSVGGLHYEPVDKLPEEGDANTIYLLPSEGDDVNSYDEWFYFDGKWEPLGTTKVDLSGYWSKNELTIMTSEELEEILNA